MPKTVWGPAPWLPKQHWLLQDGSVVETPDLETTTAQSRVRVAGTTKSVSKGQVDSLLRSAVEQIATERDTSLWARIVDPHTNLRNHRMQAPNTHVEFSFETTPVLHYATDPAVAISHYASTDIAFEFESAAYPGITAILWVILSKEGYSEDSGYTCTSLLTYQALHSSLIGEYNTAPLRYGVGGKWWTPYGYARTDAQQETDQFLRNCSLDVTFRNVKADSARAAVNEALLAVKQFTDVESILIPAWRGSGEDASDIVLEEYKFKRTNFTRSLYGEMLEFVQTKPTLDRIKRNFDEIQSDMRTLGIVSLEPRRRSSRIQNVEEIFGSDMVVHMLSQKESDESSGADGKPAIEVDEYHTVSIDLATGTVVVECLHSDESTSDITDQWKFETTKAELHGHLDAFLNYARQKRAQKRTKKFDTIVNNRTVDETPVEINVQ